jgi:hypothetical protein
MQAIREIKIVRNSRLFIDVPDEFLKKEVEVIVLPLDKVDVNLEAKNDRKTSFFQFIDRFRFKLPGDFKFVREELYDR